MYGVVVGMVYFVFGYFVVNSISKVLCVVMVMVEGLKEGGEIEASRRAWEIFWGVEL